MEKLLQGVQEFQASVFPEWGELFQKLTQEGQHPRFLFITCSDARVIPTMLTQSEPGELFVLRNAGNIVPPYTGSVCGEAASIEYAVKVLKVRHIVVCGHTHCGGIVHLIEYHEHSLNEHLPMVSKWLCHADAVRAITEAHWQELSKIERIQYAIETNVQVQLKHLETHPSVAQALNTGEISLHGWLYHVESAALHIFDPHQNRFNPLQNALPV